MRIFESHSADVDSVSDLELARARRISLRDAIPFGTRRHVVPPGRSGRAERIDGLELSRVVSGEAAVEVASRIADLQEGGSVLFDSGETHAFHNRSTIEPLVVFSVYWMPRSAPIHAEPITA